MMVKMTEMFRNEGVLSEISGENPSSSRKPKDGSPIRNQSMNRNANNRSIGG